MREAHAMSEIVQNALLKSIEEPPPHAVTILVTHLPHQLLATVRSRCQEIVIAPPPAASPRPTGWSRSPAPRCTTRRSTRRMPSRST